MFKGHIPEKYHNKTKSSKFAEHKILNSHIYTVIDNHLQILHKCCKGAIMNVLEELKFTVSFIAYCLMKENKGQVYKLWN